jgi:hypothetical protein
MIFTGTEADNEQVASCFRTMTRSAAEVDRLLSERDALALLVGTLVAGLSKAEERIEQLESRLAKLETKNT